MAVDPRMRALVVHFRGQADETAARITRAIVELERASREAPAQTALRETYDAVARDLHTLKGSSAMLALSDAADVAHGMETLLAEHKRSATPLPADVADALLKGIDDFVRRVRAHADEQARPPPAAPPDASAEQPPAPAQSVRDEAGTGWRVDARDVSAMMREAERLRELCLHLEEHGRELAGVIDDVRKIGLAAQTSAVRFRLTSLKRSLSGDLQLSVDIADTLDDALRALSTLPARTVIDPLHRAVRDLCRRQGKAASLSIVGGELALDRRLLDALGAVLAHLIRNAVDHGIESPSERETAGKHHEGALVVRIEQEGNVVFVEVSDDGRGIDVDRVRARALSVGLISEDASARMSAGELEQLVFSDGFSTRDEATETSGRGVGLAAVRRSVDALGGRVEVSTKVGQGARFVLMVPSALGASPMLIVRCGDHTMAVPLASVTSVRAARADAVRVTGERTFFTHEGELLPLRDLGALLGLREAQVPSRGQPLVLVQSEAGRAAILVDEIRGERELVLRAMPNELRDVAAYQGLATLAHGEIIAVCRPEWLSSSLSQKDALPSTRRRRALVVDDSLTARALHRTALESAGFVVHAAGSARQALEHIEQCEYDVMVCDIGMEGTDGVELTRLVRARPRTQKLPIVLVSVHDAAEDRARGLAAGADAFLSKRDCAAGRLLAEVERATARTRGAASSQGVA